MMDLHFSAAVNILAFMALVAAWFWGVKPALVETFRQYMFKLRDELFDYMAEGNISASHPAYVMVRNRMNAYIRYAERPNLLGIMIIGTYTSTRPLVRAYLSELNAAIDSLEPAQARKMEEFLNKSHRYMDLFVFARSFFLVLLMVGIWLVISAFSRSRSGVVNPFKTSKEAFDYEAATSAC